MVLVEGQPFILFDDEFTVGERLGDGSFGEVWRIYKENIEFAVKTISTNNKTVPTHFIYSDDYEVLKNESKMYLSLDLNTHLVSFVAFYIDDAENIFVVLELIPGGKLSKKIEEGFDELVTVINLAIDIAKGISHLHKSRIIHRDLNPNNILIDKFNSSIDEQEGDLVAKVSDLGLSKNVDGVREQYYNTLTGELRVSEIFSTAGNKSYIAPEQYDNFSVVNENSDIFSFGMILTEMITGKLPFVEGKFIKEDNFETSKTKIMERLNSLFTTSKFNIPIEIKDMIVKCLHYKSSFRWKTEKEGGNFKNFDSIKEELKKIQESIQGKERRLSSQPSNYHRFYQYRGFSFYKLGDFKLSKEMFSKSLELNHKNINSICGLALSYYKSEQYDLAEHHFMEVLDEKPDDDIVYVYLGNNEDERGGSLYKILKHYCKAIKINPQNFNAHFNKGYVLYKHKLYFEAKEALKEAYNINPTNARLNLYLGLTELQLGDLKKGEDYLRETLRLTEDSKYFYNDICTNLYIIGKYDLAIKYCQKGLKIHPVNNDLNQILKDLNPKEDV